MVLVKRLAITVAGLAAVVASLASCGGAAIKVDAIFADIGDLPRFANVQSSDVVVGSVRSIHLDGYHARVTMRIRSDAKIPRNAIALVRSTSLLGEKFVDLRPPLDQPPSDQPLRDGDVIPLERTQKIPGVDDALIKLGRLLEGGSAADLAVLIHSSAEVVRGHEGDLGLIFEQLRNLSPVLAARAPEVAAAIGNLDQAFRSFAAGSATIKSALSSSADALGILADQQQNLDRLVLSLDKASAVLARYTTTTRPASDRALKDLRSVLDVAMTTTGNLEKTLTALASFTDLWPRAIPGDYIQLDIVLTLANAGPPAVPASAAAGIPKTLADFLWEATR